MKPDSQQPAFPRELLDKLHAGVREGIRREVQRRRERGLPLHVARNGRVEMIWPEQSEALENGA